MKIILKIKNILVLNLFLLYPLMLSASESTESHTVPHRMMNLVLQLGIIIFAAKFFGMLFEKFKLSSVLGELIAGLIIGPYVLGGITLPTFPNGIFPLESVSTLPISIELYAIATIASIVLLFEAGLETDFEMFLKFSVTGSVLGISGVVVSFLIGNFIAMYFFKVTFMSPIALFLGVMSTPTSVGITARILSSKRKMDSPEGVSIMSGAVIDDILGIISLAIVLGISVSALNGTSDGVNWTHIRMIALKSVGVWLSFTLLGLIFAYKISSFLKSFKSISSFSVMSLGMAFILAGIFEKAGLALIIGAYVMGLSLSRTDLGFVIHDKLHTIELLLVPIFFTVMGMFVNPSKLMQKEIIIFGIIYTIGAVIAKVIGCGLPALFMNFNKIGALRIGVGMAPRGEVVLIMAGIGLSYGILDESMFGVAIIMTLFTMVLIPPLLNLILNDKSGTRKKIEKEEKVSTLYTFPTVDLTRMIESEIVDNFYKEGFFINLTKSDTKTYHIKKDTIDIIISISPLVLEFKSEKQDIPFIKNMMYESLLKFNAVISELTSILEKIDMRKEIIGKGRTNKNEIRRCLKPEDVIMNLQSKNKREVITEMIERLRQNGKISDTKSIFSAVMEREEIMSTGLSDGLAIPHAKTDLIENIMIAVGFNKEGIDFGAIDGKASKIIFLILSPENSATSHLQMVSNITSIFSDERNRKEIFNCKDPHEVYDFLSE